MSAAVFLEEVVVADGAPPSAVFREIDGNPLITEARRFSVDAAITSVRFTEDTAIFVTEDRWVVRAPIGRAESLLPIHDDTIVASDGNGKTVATASADGRIISLNAAGEIREIATAPKQRWVTCLAVSDGGTAWAFGRNAFMRAADGVEKSYQATSTITAMAFAPDGLTLALSVREGLVLWRPFSDSERQLPAVVGVALGLNFSPDGHLIAESFYEPAVSIRRIDTGEVISLRGPTTQVRSTSWSERANTLIAGGARQLMVWPLQYHQERLSTLPRLLAPYKHPVMSVAHHPSRRIAAVGYQDGLVLLVRLYDGAEVLLQQGGCGAISGMSWNHRGDRLAIGAEDGGARLFGIGFN
jgi:WD40 repeat protein